jgi:hypothetical protein
MKRNTRKFENKSKNKVKIVNVRKQCMEGGGKPE